MPITLTTKTTADALWTTRLELETMFGRTNVMQWADVENSRDEETIRQAICAACEDATDDARSRLSGGPCGTVVVPSRTLRRMTTRLAAGLLYEARGVHDTSDENGRFKLKWSLDRADKWFRQVQAGQIILEGIVNDFTAVPFVSPHLMRHNGLFGPLLNQEQTQRANEREEIAGVPSYRWFYGDGFSNFIFG